MVEGAIAGERGFGFSVGQRQSCNGCFEKNKIQVLSDKSKVTVVEDTFFLARFS